MNFADLKRKSGESSLENLVKKLETKTYGDADNRFWSPTQDQKTGLGSAVIRFLPTAPENDSPWVKCFKHSFKNEVTGKWFIEECPTTIGNQCPVCTGNQPLWNGSEADKKIAGQRKRKTSYVANVLVIKDPANPENEGQIKLFSFGKQIFDKIIAMIKPEFEDQSPVNVFDFWQGADFRLRINKNEGGYRSYDKSTFDSPSALYGGDDDKLEDLWLKQYDLREFLDPKRFKTEEEIQKKFNDVVNGGAAGASSAANRVLEDLESRVSEAPKFKSEEQKSPAKSVEIPAASSGDDSDWESLLADI